MKHPLVTVIIPVYNVEAYLDQCVESVVGQTYTNLEIILVDDGSPDRCPEMCDIWAQKDSRIHVIHQKNTGQGLARNAGMAVASGDYVFFFDSDDYVDCTIVEKCVSSAVKNDSDAVLFGRWDVYETGQRKPNPLRVTQTLFQGAEVTEHLLPKLFTYELGLGVGACGRMYRFQLLRDHDIQFLSERKMASEDACFALMFFSHARNVSIVPQQLYFYRRHENSFSRSYKNDRQIKNDIFLDVCLDYIAQSDMPAIVTSHLKVRYHLYTIAAMKQILQSELSKTEKKAALWTIFRNPTLHRTLSKDVLQLEKKSQQLFFGLLKFRCYELCRWLLALKTKTP